LKKLDIYCGNDIKISGLNGWVYEQTLQFCLKNELDMEGINIVIEEQYSLNSRIRVDLRIGKAKGMFSDDVIQRYTSYIDIANQRSLYYFYITGNESVERYRKRTIDIFGKERSFFLNVHGDWNRFIKELFKVIR